MVEITALKVASVIVVASVCGTNLLRSEASKGSSSSTLKIRLISLLMFGACGTFGATGLFFLDNDVLIKMGLFIIVIFSSLGFVGACFMPKQSLLKFLSFTVIGRGERGDYEN